MCVAHFAQHKRQCMLAPRAGRSRYEEVPYFWVLRGEIVEEKNATEQRY